jgi:hypothetical protein
MPGTLYQNPTLFNESVSAVTASNTVALGALRWEGGNQYVYGYLDSSTPASAVPGNALNILSGGSGYTWTTSMAIGDFAIGVVQNTTITTGTYGWLLQNGKGYGQASTISAVAQAQLLGVTASMTFGAFINQASGTTGGSPQCVVGRAVLSATTGSSFLANFFFPNG